MGRQEKASEPPDICFVASPSDPPTLRCHTTQNGECDAMGVCSSVHHHRHLWTPPPPPLHRPRPTLCITVACLSDRTAWQRASLLSPRSHHSWNLRNRRSPCHYHSSKNSTVYLVIYTLLSLVCRYLPHNRIKF